MKMFLNYATFDKICRLYNQTNKNIFALLPDAADAMRGYLHYC